MDKHLQTVWLLMQIINVTINVMHHDWSKVDVFSRVSIRTWCSIRKPK